VTTRSGLAGIQGFGLSTADLNGDGWPDLTVAGNSPVYGPGSSPAARIFVNDRSGTFHEIANSVLSWDTYSFNDDATGVSVGDLNRDGLPDIIMGHHFDSVRFEGTTQSIHAYLNRGPGPNGDPSFEDITATSGLPPLHTLAPDVQIADFDNDGWPDIVTSASAGEGTRPAVFRNLGPVAGVPRFSSPDGLGDPQFWVNVSIADVDRDGRVDAFVDEFDPNRAAHLFANATPGGHWLDVSVDGPGQGVGTRVEVFAAGGLDDPSALLGVHEIVVSSGFGSGLAPIAHFGLGGATSVDLRLRRPRRGPVTDLRGVAANGTIRVPARSSPRPPGDHDGDGDTDMGVFRPSNGTWYVHGGPSVSFGTSGDVPVPGDYDGDGTADVAVFRPSDGTWYVHGATSAAWGVSGDVPVPGDYDGDGDTDMGVFRPSDGRWYVRDGPAVAFGTAGDIPVPGDYDGDGHIDIAVFRPSNGTWYVHGGATAAWGVSGDLPVVGRATG
jgi:hypothetical protein